MSRMLMEPASQRTLSGRSINLRPWAGRCARLARIGGVVYLGITLVLLLLENTMLFRPVRAPQSWREPPNAQVQDVQWRLADGTLIHAWWCPTEHWTGDQGALLFCHGNSGNLSHRGKAISAWQQELGCAVLIMDYPGFGKSGGEPSEAGCYAAADAAYDWLTRDQGVAPDRLLIYGESLGGGVAVDLASRRPHRALIVEKAFTSFPDLAQAKVPWLPGRWLVQNRFDNLDKIRRCCGPIFITHGTADSLIPFQEGEELFAAAPGPKEFLAMEGFGHHNLLAPIFFAKFKHFLAESEGHPSGTLAHANP
jgi:fermentation-respiration switch protein FrsA (DUF1100 family)